MFLPQRLAVIDKLKTYLTTNNTEWQQTVALASYKNAWFTVDYINKAVTNITTAFLQPHVLQQFVNNYKIPNITNAKTVGIVMAGNIPLVGFHDFLCVFLSGHKAKIKLSSKDEVLLKHIILKLNHWEPATVNLIETAEMLKNCDAYIATGSGSTSNYFNYYFGKYPNIIRSNRTSVALLQGNETETELNLLADDIHEYYGLGCRNVTKIFVPKNYDFIPFINACKKYLHFENQNSWKNNYDYQLSILMLNNTYYMSTGSLLITESEQLFSSIAQIHYSQYENVEVCKNDLENNNKIQLIVGKNYEPFGSTQSPNIYQYADGVDTMAFLLKLIN